MQVYIIIIFVSYKQARNFTRLAVSVDHEYTAKKSVCEECGFAFSGNKSKKCVMRERRNMETQEMCDLRRASEVNFITFRVHPFTVGPV